MGVGVEVVEVPVEEIAGGLPSSTSGGRGRDSNSASGGGDRGGRWNGLRGEDGMG